MKKIIVFILVLLLAGCSKVSEAEQYVIDNPGVTEGDPVIEFSNPTTSVKMFEVIEDSTSKVLFSIDTEEVIILYVYCEESSFESTVEYEERIFSSDTYYGFFDKPSCESHESITVYYNESKARGDWVNLGEIPKQKSD